jgi:hypothetical protein
VPATRQQIAPRLAAALVLQLLPKLDVAGSIPVSRSIF